MKSFSPQMGNVRVALLWGLHDEASIAAMAFSCPYIKGDAVYSARAYYTAIHPGAFFDDEQLCYGSYKKERANLNDFASIKPEYTRQFHLYPNPTSAELYIYCQLQADEELSVGIYDLQGRLVSEKVGTDSYVLFDLSAIASGVYVCKTSTSLGFNETERIVINK